MVKVFTVNKQGKIVLTKRELEQVLNEAWNDGYKANYTHSYWWNSPTIRSGGQFVTSLESVPSEDVNVSSESVSRKYGI